MQDIIIEERTPATIRVNKSKAIKRRPDRENNGFCSYLGCWIKHSLIAALFLSLDFILYASSGSYKIFPSFDAVSMETVYILGGIWAFSFLLMYLLSFSLLLQNVATALIMAFTIMAGLYQFANFDVNAMLSNLVANYINTDLGTLLRNNVKIVMTVVLFILFWLYLVFTKPTGLNYFIGILVLIGVGITFQLYKNRDDNQAFEVVFDHTLPDPDVKSGKKFVYIAVPGLTSYNYLRNFYDVKNLNPDYNQKTTEHMQRQLGFYAQNDFLMYPHAFIKEKEPYYNVVDNFNFSGKVKAEDNLLQTIIPEKYWRFDNRAEKFVYLKDNSLFRVFNRSGYKIKSYQGTGIETCKVNMVSVANKCVNKGSLPIDLSTTGFSTKDKAIILAGEWLESLDIPSDLSSIYKLLSYVVDVKHYPLVGMSYKNLYVVDSLKALDIAAEDIVKDTQNTAYFIYLDMPDMYVYDEFCKIKPLNEWENKTDLAWVPSANLFKKRMAYMDQMSCVYGALETFIQKLSKGDVIDNTVIAIMGVSGLNGLTPQMKTPGDYAANILNEKMVTVALKDPLKKSFVLKNDLCSSSSILKQYLYKKDQCDEKFDFNMHVDARNALENVFKNFLIEENDIFLSQNYFNSWYQKWAENNHFEALPEPEPKSVIERNAIFEEPESNGDIEIKENKIITSPVEDVPEAATSSLAAAMQADNSEKSEEIPLEKGSGEVLEKPKEIVEIKIIEKTMQPVE